MKKKHLICFLFVLLSTIPAMASFCTHCGINLPVQANFCPNCGVNVAKVSCGTLPSGTSVTYKTINPNGSVSTTVYSNNSSYYSVPENRTTVVYTQPVVVHEEPRIENILIGGALSYAIWKNTHHHHHHHRSILPPPPPPVHRIGHGYPMPPHMPRRPHR